MTQASHWTASDGTQLHYRYDDYTDPWKSAPTLLMLHSAMSSAKRFYSMVPGLARHNVFDYLPERCVADALAFLQKHFPHERGSL